MRRVPRYPAADALTFLTCLGPPPYRQTARTRSSHLRHRRRGATSTILKSADSRSPSESEFGGSAMLCPHAHSTKTRSPSVRSETRCIQRYDGALPAENDERTLYGWIRQGDKSLAMYEACPRPSFHRKRPPSSSTTRVAIRGGALAARTGVEAGAEALEKLRGELEALPAKPSEPSLVLRRKRR